MASKRYADCGTPHSYIPEFIVIVLEMFRPKYAPIIAGTTVGRNVGTRMPSGHK